MRDNTDMPANLEARRRAVVEALRAISTTTPVVGPAAPVATAAPAIPPVPVVDAVVDAVEARLDAVSAKISEVLARLDSVETALLEAAWERPPAVPPAADDDVAADERVSVPKVPLNEGRMSSVAADVLFGG